jgi:hypothetical protein
LSLPPNKVFTAVYCLADAFAASIISNNSIKLSAEEKVEQTIKTRK